MKTTHTLLFICLSYFAFSQTLSLEAGTTRAVVVGIADYQDDEIPDLRFSDKDAQAFVEFLQSPAGGSVLDEHMIVLMNEKATNARIADALIWLLEESQKGDKAIIYFSGHGDVETITRFNRGYLLTYDSPPKIYMAGALNIRDLQDIISTLSDNEVQVVMISDACRAGKLAGSEVGGTEATAQNLSKQFSNEVKILSCQPNEFSLEGEQWGGGRGAFSYHLLDGLYGLADKSGDGQVNLFEIGRYLEDLVPQETAPHAQMPFTVGDRNTRLAIVDQVSLEQLEEKKSTEQSTLSMIETKGMEEILLAKVDSNIQQMYSDFLVALDNKQLLEPAETCAYDLYQKLSQEASIQDLHNIMRRNLSVALQEDAQQAVNAYLAANPTEIQRRYESEENYNLYPRYLEKAAELLGEKHFYYKNLMAKKYYFEGLKLRLDIDKGDQNVVYQAAIEQQLKALEYQAHAPFILNELGVLHTQLKLDNQAFEYYDKAIELTPEWGLPYLNYSVSLFYIGEHKKAITYGKKALEFLPNFPQLYNFLAWISSNERDWINKQDWARRGLELADDFYLIENNVHTTAQLKIRYKEAIELLEKAKTIDSTFYSTYVNLGSIYFQIQEFEKSEEAYHAAFRIDSTRNELNMSLGRLYLGWRKTEKGKAALLKYIDLAPNNRKKSYGYNSLQWAYLQEGDIESSTQLLLKSIELYPSNPYPYTNLSSRYMGQGKYQEAEKLILDGIRYNPSNPILYNRIVRCYGLLNRDQEVNYFVKEGLELKTDNVKLLNTLTDYYQNSHQLEKALEWQQNLLDISSDDSETHRKYGELVYLNGDTNKAKIHFDKAVDLSPSFIWIPLRIANFFRIHNEPDKAEKYLQIGLKIDSTNNYAYQIKSFLLYDKGLLNEALDNIDRGIALQKSSDDWAGLLLLKSSLCYYAKEYDKGLMFSQQLEKEVSESRGVSFLFQKLIEEDYQSAETALGAFLKIYPTDPGSHHLNAIIKTKLGKYEEALKSLKLAVKIHPYHTFQNNPNLEPLHQLQGYQQLMREVYPEKFDDLDTFDFRKEESRYYFKNCITLAKYYESQKEYERANFLFKKAIELQPDTLTNNQAMVLADAYLILGEVEKARAICPEGIESEEDTELLEAGKLLYRLGKKDQAATHFEKYLEVSKNGSSRDFVIMFYKGQGDFEMAKLHSENGIKIAPKRIGYRRSFARLYFFNDKKQRAYQMLEQALKINPDEFNTYALIAILRYFDNPTTAKKHFESAAKINLKFLDLWTCLELMRNNEFEEADNAWAELVPHYENIFWLQMVKYKYVQMKIRQEEYDHAIELFGETLVNGRFVNYQLLSTDKALDSIREMEGFKKLMQRYFPEKMN